MGVVKGNLEVAIKLSKATCYFMRTGKCSLSLVNDYYVATSTKTAANDLLYCPRLYRAMCNRERGKAIAITPCECGHAEVVSGHQRACIASQKRLPLAVRAAEEESKPSCPICDGQLTFEEQNTGGARIVTIRAVIDTGEEEETREE